MFRPMETYPDGVRLEAAVYRRATVRNSLAALFLASALAAPVSAQETPPETGEAESTDRPQIVVYGRGEQGSEAVTRCCAAVNCGFQTGSVRANFHRPELSRGVLAKPSYLR